MRRRVGPSTVIAVLVAGACALTATPASGASDGATTTAPTTVPPTTTSATNGGGVRGVTDTTITIGGFGQVGRYPGADVGAKARFKRANDGGGVNGRTFNYLGMRDDLGIAKVNADLANTYVQQDNVFAVVPVVTPDLGAAETLVKNQVPYFGWAVSSNFCGNQWGFSFTGCMFPPDAATTSNAWATLVRKNLGAKSSPTAVILTENTDSGKYFASALDASVKSAGFTVLSSANSLPVPAVSDYDALARQILGSNNSGAPDAVFVNAGYANVAQVRQAVRNAGYDGVFTNTVEYESSLVASSTGSFVFSPTAAVESAPTNPAMAQLVADVRAVAPDQPIDQSVIAGYWSADLFINAVERAGKRLTAESLVTKANTKFTYSVTGTVGPVKFPGAHNEPAACGTLVQSTGTVYNVAEPYACAKVVSTKA
ncbi:MAG: ABC transporter substrate-binding protein [Acidimicrobiia bacterium]